jgi:hypothetical protein
MFIVQLEYVNEVDALDEILPHQVVRSDHDETGEQTPHDVRIEGMHWDVYRDGENVEGYGTGPAVYNPTKAYELAMTDVKNNWRHYLRRIKRWHDAR